MEEQEVSLYRSLEGGPNEGGYPRLEGAPQTCHRDKMMAMKATPHLGMLRVVAAATPSFPTTAATVSMWSTGRKKEGGR